MGKPTIHASTMTTPHFPSQIEKTADSRRHSGPASESHEAVAGFAPHETGLPSQRAAPGSSLLFGPGLDPPDPLADHNALIAATSAVLKDARRRWDTAIYKTGLLAAKAAGSSDHLRRPDTGDASPVSCSSPPPIGPYEAELRRVILSFGPPPKGSSLFPEMEP
jgi:hypothetical protein